MYPMVKMTHSDTGIEFYVAPSDITRVESRQNGAIVFTQQGKFQVKASAESVANAVATAIEWKESRAIAAQVHAMRQMQQQQSGLVVPTAAVNLNGG